MGNNITRDIVSTRQGKSMFTFFFIRVMHNCIHFYMFVEYIGTVNRLVDPLIFEASSIFYFQSKTSDATSQIQIKNPGETKGDISGNERW